MKSWIFWPIIITLTRTCGNACKIFVSIITHDGGSNELPFNSGGIYFYDKDLGLFPINSHNFLLELYMTILVIYLD